jgi:8-oxo-dGTP pyrophosphatase MutT (NUDIX family)
MNPSHEEIAKSEEFKTMPRKRIGAGVVAVDDHMRVLLVEPTYKTNWEVPGGLVELGEPPRIAAARECREELGFDVIIGRLLVMDWVPPRRLPDDGHMLLFAVGPIDVSQIELPPEELKSWLWCDRGMMQERLSDFMFRRIESALTAITSGMTVELENGYPAHRL